MTREKAIKIFRKEIECLSHSRCEDCILEKVCDPMKTPLDSEYIDAYEISIGALEQELNAVQFAKWVATEIFDENWEYNKDAFAEIACRKLAKLGIVRAKGDEWELVELPESEGKE